MKKILFIINAPAYGSERMLSALRLATALMAQENTPVALQIFMISDAVTVALPQQASANAGGGLQEMLETLIQQNAKIFLCRTCIAARGLLDLELIPGIAIGTMPELAAMTLAADQVITF